MFRLSTENICISVHEKQYLNVIIFIESNKFVPFPATSSAINLGTLGSIKYVDWLRYFLGVKFSRSWEINQNYLSYIRLLCFT